MLCARCGQRPRNLALSTSPHQRAGRERRRRHQPWGGRGRRSPVHGDRSRTPDRARSIQRRSPLGYRDGRLAAELQRHGCATGGWRSRDCGYGRRRAGRARISVGLRSGNREGAVAILDRPEAGRAGIGNLAGQRHRASGRRDVDDRRLRSRSAARLLDDRQSESRLQRGRSARRQPVCELRCGARGPHRPAQVAFPVHATQRLGLGCAAADRARRHYMGRPAAQAHGAGQPQRVLLRSRSDRREIPARGAVCEKSDVGERDWT